MRIHSLRLLTLPVAVILAACAPAPESVTPTAGPVRPTRTPPPTATPAITPTAEAGEENEDRPPPLPSDRNAFFLASGACAVCHENLLDDSGADVSLGTAWRSTMMANSARDPYWQASLRAEVEAHPELRESIEELCTRCHMPMAHFTASVREETTAVLDGGFLDPSNELHAFAMDGVSCAVCHQIREEGLGLPESYTGGYSIDSELPDGQRLSFGPYSIEENQASIMQAGSGHIPTQGLHVTTSEMCATCHTLYTPYVDALGQPAGEFPEQVTYLEWFYSSYRRTDTCQECHMPDASGGVRVANSSVNPRSPFAQHTFEGANAYMLRVLERFGAELGATASPAQFADARQRAETLLGEATAQLTFDEVALSGVHLSAEVVLENLAGHKFPSAFPSRRAWLHLTVTDSSGQVIFESGAYGDDGAIVANDNDADPTSYEPHYRAIVNPEQVQIYETILRDSEGAVTTQLLRAAGYLKDNRLLPWGFEKSAPYEDIAVRGEARDDQNFLEGGDRVLYDINLGGSAGGPYTLKAELLFQSVSYRWMENLRGLPGEEIDRFLGYAGAVSNVPVVVAAAEATAGN
jgi:Cytochrome c554 and c-prime